MSHDIPPHAQEPSHVHVEYECELAEILTSDEIKLRKLNPSIIDSQQQSTDPQHEGWQVYVLLTNGQLFGCDLVVSATGASPNITSITASSGQLKLSDEGGVVIDNEMRTNITDVYAAGDVCTANWSHSQLWFQV